MGRKFLRGMRGLDSWFGVARRRRCAGVERPCLEGGMWVRRLAILCGTAVMLLAFVMLCPSMPKPVHADGEETTVSTGTRAASTVGLSVPGTIPFEEVTVAPEGSTTTATASIGVTTSESAGYKLYLYAEDNNLRAKNPQTEEVISATESTQSLENLEVRTWGYDLTAGEAAGTSFARMPEDGTNPIVEKDTAEGNAANDVYTLTLGAKLDSTTPSGTYVGKITMSVVAEPAKIVVTYDANGGYFNNDEDWTSDAITYTMEEDPIPSGEVMTPTRPGYLFWGWYNDVAGSWQNEFEVSADMQTSTVYAKWLLEVGPIQDYTNAQCAAQASTTEVAATDSRGGVENVYSLRYLTGSDGTGVCWMTTNLRIASGTKLTSMDSDLPEGVTYTIPEEDPTLGASYEKGWVRGSLYNYCAASAGQFCSQDIYILTTQSICPKGWELPYSADYDWEVDQIAAFAPVATGYFTGGHGQAASAAWWTRTLPGFTGSHSVLLYSANVNTLEGGHTLPNSYGLSVRCVRSD